MNKISWQYILICLLFSKFYISSIIANEYEAKLYKYNYNYDYFTAGVHKYTPEHQPNNRVRRNNLGANQYNNQPAPSATSTSKL